MADMLETEAIIFDSSVILKLDKKGMKEKTKEIVKDFVDPQKFQKNYEKAFKNYQKGLFKTTTEFFEAVFKGLKVPQRKIKNIIIRHDNWRRKYVKLNPYAKSVLNYLSENYKLGLISNMPKEWFNNDAQMTGLNHKRLMQAEIFSQEVGILKPDIRIFAIAANRLFTSPKRCAYVTNHKDEAEGAKRAGMQVIFVGDEEIGDYNIKNLSELIDLFENPDAFEPQEVKVRDK